MDDLAEALRDLTAGAPIVVPTDTVYGIAASYRTERGVRAIFELKGRPENKPLPVLASSAADLSSVAELDHVRAVTERFWPGPLTLVCGRAPGFDFDLGGDERDTVAVRVPACKLLLRLLARAGPLAVTSANRSGEPPATTVVEARALFGSTVAVYLDGGPAGGHPSTVVSVVGTRPKVLRAGALDPEAVLELL